MNQNVASNGKSVEKSKIKGGVDANPHKGGVDANPHKYILE